MERDLDRGGGDRRHRSQRHRRDPGAKPGVRLPGGGTFTIVASTVTCPSGSPPGVYASVSAQLQYQTVLPYPGLPSPLTLTGQAYRRIK